MVGEPGRLVIVSRCFASDGISTSVLQAAQVDADGKITSLGERHEGEYHGDVFVASDGRRLSTHTGKITDDSPWPGELHFSTPDGAFTYRAVEDPRRGYGCDAGLISATTFIVSDSTGVRPALGLDGFGFSWLNDAFVAVMEPSPRSS